jgi:hypothetical protein
MNSKGIRSRLEFHGNEQLGGLNMRNDNHNIGTF